VAARLTLPSGRKICRACFELRGNPLSVAVNKVDSRLQEANASQFHTIGAPIFPIAAEQDTGVDDLNLDERDKAGDSSQVSVVFGDLGRNH
jgi:predicted GTPase